MASTLTINEKEYTSATLVAKHFGYTKEYILLLIKRGKIDGQKIKNKWYANTASVDTFLKLSDVEKEKYRKSLSAERRREHQTHLRIHSETRMSPAHTHKHKALTETFAIVVIGITVGIAG